MNDDRVSLLYVPVPDAETGEGIASQLLEAGLVACANLHGPMHSIYRWEGRVCREPEFALLLKTTPGCAAAAASAVERLHPYDCPCVLRGECGANAAFAAWVGEQVRGG